MTAKPSLVILTTEGANGTDIVKGILEAESVPAPKTEPGGIACWVWEVENKYYTASVQMALVESLGDNLSWIQTNGEALLIYCDTTRTDVLNTLNGLVEKIGDFEPEVQLLVCDTCSSDDSDKRLSRLTAQQWCVTNGWELIELHPHSTEPEYSDEEDDFPESFGFKRIRQALHAHTWSNLTMKDSQGQGSRLGAVLQSAATADDRSNAETEEVLYSRLADLTVNEDQSTSINDTSIARNGMCNNPELATEGVLGSSALGGELGSFDDLFSNFEHLKRTAAGLPPDQRRDYAERVAVAFWRAMGGDEDEVTGLDSEGEI